MLIARALCILRNAHKNNAVSVLLNMHGTLFVSIIFLANRFTSSSNSSKSSIEIGFH